MLKLVHPLVCVAVIALAVAGCKKEKTAAEMNAEKEKAARETRRVQAAKYYGELVEKYPDTPFAPQARERLQAIGPVATPAGAKPATPKPAGASATPAANTAQK